MSNIEDITNEIDITLRTVKDVEYKCPKCKSKNYAFDVDTGEYNTRKCVKCDYKVKFFVEDFM